MQVPRRLVPKYRRPVLVNGVDERLNRILLDTAKDRGSEVMEFEVMPDHVHLLTAVDPPYGVHRMIRKIKGRSYHIRRRKRCAHACGPKLDLCLRTRS
jgi:putative transposase